jgi:geranylgeranyl pyrophosphate synthase
MTSFPATVPLSGHRARVAQYLRRIAFSSESVAGRIIEERLPMHQARDPIRPSLVLWACAAVGEDVTDAVPVAASFYLFDRFMVLHDELAHASGSTVERWGLGQTLNAGDALYAMAFRALASDVAQAARRLKAARLVGQAVLEAIEEPVGDTSAHSGLTGAALHAGAVIGGASDRIARSFARAGRLVGDAAQNPDAQVAGKMAREAVAAVARHAGRDDVHAFEEVAHYVAQRAA